MANNKTKAAQKKAKKTSARLKRKPAKAGKKAVRTAKRKTPVRSKPVLPPLSELDQEMADTDRYMDEGGGTGMELEIDKEADQE